MVVKSAILLNIVEEDESMVLVQIDWFDNKFILYIQPYGETGIKTITIYNEWLTTPPQICEEVLDFEHATHVFECVIETSVEVEAEVEIETSVSIIQCAKGEVPELVAKPV